MQVYNTDGAKQMSDVEKLSGKELVETIKDTIYEVLEEELDARLKQTKKSKTLKENRNKALRVKRYKRLKEAKKRLANIKRKKAALRENYKRLERIEKVITKK